MTQQLSLPFEQPIDREAQALVERCRQAAWLIDAGQGRVVAASAEGAALFALEQDRGGWLGRGDAGADAPARDRQRRTAGRGFGIGTPALLDAARRTQPRLRDPSRRAGGAAHAAAGDGRRPCRPPGRRPCDRPGPTARTDAETLELIARRIRETAATRAPAADLEPPDDAAAEPAPAASPAPDPAAAARPDVARLAHELKTPLSAIAAAAEIMRDERLGPLGSDRYRDYAADICDSARHALALIASMLRHPARWPEPPALAFAEIDVNALAERSASAMRPLSRRRGSS